MSTAYNPRKAPNVSQYLANLNQLPSAQDLSLENDFALDNGNLDFFTNTQFNEVWDSFMDVGQPEVAPPSRGQPGVPGVTGGSWGSHLLVRLSADAQKGSQFQFQTYPSPPSNSPGCLDGLQGQYPVPPQQVPFTAPPAAQAGDKRKSGTSSVPSAADLEEQSRMAAEEDKRRRNTAASARFRVKKKQREQALEKQAKEMTNRLQHLEGKVKQLEIENNWLKGLITDRHGGKSLDVLRQEKADNDRIISAVKDGVGTEHEETLHDNDEADADA